MNTDFIVYFLELIATLGFAAAIGICMGVALVLFTPFWRDQ